MGTKIECTIRRPGGSIIEFPEWPSGNVPDKTAPAATYHFKPESTAADSPHVAVVSHRAHVDRLLSIPGYRLAVIGDDAGALAMPPAPAPVPPVGETGSAADATATAVNVTDGVNIVATGADAVVPSPQDPVVAEIAELPIRDLKAKINTFSSDQLIAALALERAKEDPRKTFIEVVEAHLGDGAGGAE